MQVVQSDSSSREGPAIPLLHTLRVYQSITEGAAACRDSVLSGVGEQDDGQAVHRPALRQEDIPGRSWPSWPSPAPQRGLHVLGKEGKHALEWTKIVLAYNCQLGSESAVSTFTH